MSETTMLIAAVLAFIAGFVSLAILWLLGGDQ
jgi:hypothetical protein